MEKVKITIEDSTTIYEYKGYYGSVLQSEERGLKIGDLRKIKGYTFQVSSIDSTGSIINNILGKKEISWIPSEKYDQDWIRDFKKEITI